MTKQILFLMMNDDCICKILDWLSLDDLCLASRTCNRLQTLCKEQLLRKYEKCVSNEVQISFGLDGKLYVSPLANYVKCFNNFIENLKITVWNFDQNNDLASALAANFVKTKCNLTKISIDGEFESELFVKKTQKDLRNVEVVEFININETSQNEATLLRHCINVKTLILNEWHVDNINAILTQKCHKLTSFRYIGGLFNLKVDKLKTFFKKNILIRSVVLEVNDGDLAEDSVADCIQTLQYAKGIEHLSLSIHPMLANSFAEICNQLCVLCDRTSLKFLEMTFISQTGSKVLEMHANILANLEKLTKIHLHDVNVYEVMPALKSFRHLKVLVLHDLQLQDSWFRWRTFDDMLEVVGTQQDMALPQVEEVQIIGMEENRFIFILHLTRQWINLKKVIVRTKDYFFDDNFNVPLLNQAREKLPSASELTIFSDREDNTSDLQHKLVKFKIVKFDSSTNA